MKYELRCRFIEDDDIFAYAIISKGNDDFEWTISDVTKTRFLLTNNGIIFKCSLLDENFIFEVAKSNGTNINEKLILNKNGNYMEFESDDSNIFIIYDFCDFPDIKREIAGNIISEFIFKNENGIFEEESEYKDFEDKIIEIFDKYKLFNKIGTKKTTTHRSKRVKKNIENTENIQNKSEE